MTLLDMEGFDHKQASPSRPGWVNNGAAWVGSGRFGGFSMVGTSNFASYSPATPISGAAIAGVAFFADTTQANSFLEFKDGSVVHVALYWNGSTGKFDLYRGATLIASSTNVFSSAAWHYVEAKVTVADSGGTVIVRVDGNVEINFTGDTRNAATAQVSTITFRSQISTSQLDDVYIADGVGAAPYNDFLGDVKVETLIPNADGAFSQLLGSDGNSVSNWQQVDEIPPSATDYNGSATVGQRDTYGLTDLVTASGQALAVGVIAFAHKSDAGTANLKTIQRLSGGTERVDSAVALSATVNTPVAGSIQVVDPSNAAWTIASVNGMQIGVEVA